MWGVLSSVQGEAVSTTVAVDTASFALVAVAAAAEAAGREQQSDDRLRAARELNARAPTYYGSAWTALGRILLDTELLGACR
jgi:hypothetical protein